MVVIVTHDSSDFLASYAAPRDRLRDLPSLTRMPQVATDYFFATSVLLRYIAGFVFFFLGAFCILMGKKSRTLLFAIGIVGIILISSAMVLWYSSFVHRFAFEMLLNFDNRFPSIFAELLGITAGLVTMLALFGIAPVLIAKIMWKKQEIPKSVCP